MYCDLSWDGLGLGPRLIKKTLKCDKQGEVTQISTLVGAGLSQHVSWS